MKSRIMSSIKEQLIGMANEIRELKTHRPLSNRVTWDIDELDCHIKAISAEFRSTHIAYCEVRGKTRDQIEKPSDNNKADEYWVTRIKDHLLAKLEEERYEQQNNVCSCAN